MGITNNKSDMMKIYKLIVLSLFVMLLFTNCDKTESIDDITLPKGEVAVVYDNPNNVVVTADYANAFLYSWDMDNGDQHYAYELTEVEAYYPFKGSYDVTLVVSGKGGETKVNQQVVIESTDPVICENETIQFLTGGCDDEDGMKTWVWSTEARAIVLYVPAWGNMELYASGANELDPEAYDDDFTFALQGSYNVISDDRTLCNWPILEVGHTPDEGICDIANPEDSSWSIYEEEGVQYLTIGQSYLGHYHFVDRYKIIELSADKLVVEKEEPIYLPTNNFSVNGMRIMTFVPEE